MTKKARVVRRDTTSSHPTRGFKHDRTKVFAIVKALDWHMTIEDCDLLSIADETGVYFGTMSAENWLHVIKAAMRSGKRC